MGKKSRIFNPLDAWMQDKNEHISYRTDFLTDLNDSTSLHNHCTRNPHTVSASLSTFNPRLDSASDEPEDFPPASITQTLQGLKRAELLRDGAGAPVLDGSEYSRVKHVFEVVLRQSRTLHIVVSSDPVGQPPGPAEVHWLAAPLVQLDEDVHVVAKVRLRPHQNDRRCWVVCSYLGDPF